MTAGTSVDAGDGHGVRVFVEDVYGFEIDKERSTQLSHRRASG